ncbi:Methyltransferase domain-containing protein [Halopseudomonas sabulinigri]|uniref:Methyltransferase domain-containing protein n=1 Tax=Halopseudomonas sabulinigri TaxID=472181 RepID=A0A1H1SJ71_9GAMM|nr:methyltransferase [Halopseudomonas sabulinigri]SDS47913.1 Methyltransferase domain-containing protein [Halopseudomonas sabulinigri]
MSLAAHFAELDQWLQQHQALWRAKPFTQPSLAWEADWPELAHWLRQRTLAEAEAAHHSPQQLQAPEPFAALAADSLRLSQLPRWQAELAEHLPEPLYRHIPGRKWQQITHFADVARAGLQRPATRWVDWCAGKGHLGRLLAWQGGQPLVCLEHDAALNQAGAALSQALAVAAQHRQADVLAPSCAEHLTGNDSIVALHACGQLHMTLLQQLVANHCRQLALAPCCYNRIDSECYQPLSSVARAAHLQLSRDDLALPMQETVTAGQRERQQRDRSMAWRLAFDLWQREARGIDSYLPTPSKPPGGTAQGFAGFCRSLTTHHQLHLPAPSDWRQLEARGWQRLAEVRNLELLRGLFRRPLEVWLLLDRALYLQKSGYRVQLGEFCPASLTPRNVLLLAEKQNP